MTPDPNEKTLIATQQFAGMLLELARDGMLGVGATLDHANHQLVNYALMAGLNLDTYEPIVKYGAAYRGGLEHVLTVAARRG